MSGGAIAAIWAHLSCVHELFLHYCRREGASPARRAARARLAGFPLQGGSNSVTPSITSGVRNAIVSCLASRQSFCDYTSCVHHRVSQLACRSKQCLINILMYARLGDEEEALQHHGLSFQAAPWHNGTAAEGDSSPQVQCWTMIFLCICCQRQVRNFQTSCRRFRSLLLVQLYPVNLVNPP